MEYIINDRKHTSTRQWKSLTDTRGPKGPKLSDSQDVYFNAKSGRGLNLYLKDRKIWNRVWALRRNWKIENSIAHKAFFPTRQISRRSQKRTLSHPERTGQQPKKKNKKQKNKQVGPAFSEYGQFEIGACLFLKPHLNLACTKLHAKFKLRQIRRIFTWVLFVRII